MPLGDRSIYALGALTSGRRYFSGQLVANGFLSALEPQGALGGTISVGMLFTKWGLSLGRKTVAPLRSRLTSASGSRLDSLLTK